jgi:adenylate kinase family enzyme
MKRTMIIGCCGAGKSTFSRALHSLSKIELIHLDQHYWKPNWKETNSEDWKKIVQEFANKSSWIIDGNYGETMDIRIQRADTIIYLDYSTSICLKRVLFRTLKYWRKERPDMPDGCKERFDVEFFHYVATFNLKRRKKILKKLRAVKHKKKILIFRNRKETTKFLDNYTA